MQGIEPFWFGVVADITERKRTEEELRIQHQNFQESEARLQKSKKWQRFDGASVH